jgi:hypothetical protein
MTQTTRQFSLALQLLCAAALMLVAWGLAAELLLGFAVNPAALDRSMADGSLDMAVATGCCADPAADRRRRVTAGP